jgi:hypothetical protein
MSNVLTALAPILWGDARLVPRELTGFLGACDRSFNDQGVALNDVVKVPISPTMSVSTLSPGATFPAGDNRTFTSKTLTLAQSAEVSWHLEAEQERSLMNGGTNAISTLKQTINQGCRAITNQIEAYLGTVADANASRATTGTPGTSPFATDQKPLADVLKMLLDNGASKLDLSCIINTTAGADLRKVSGLFKVNEAGSDELLRRGGLGRLYDMGIVESAGVASHTAGTGASYLINNGSVAVGTTTLTVDGGTGTILPGDIITLQTDGNKYVVVSSVGGATVTSIEIQEPGLRVATVNDRTVTVTATHTANIAMARNALCAVIRPALQPVGPVAEQMVISDPETGLSFLLLRVVQDGMVSWFMRSVYDAFAPNPYGIVKLVG